MINKDTLLSEVLEQNENAGEIFQNYGMHCIGCMAMNGETVGEAAEVHGVDVEALLKDLNK